MNLWQRLRRALNVDVDALAEYRHRIGINLGALCGSLLVPFAIMHALNQHWQMALLNTVLAVVLLGSSWAVRQGRRPPVPFPILACMLIAGVCISVLKQGVPGVLWAYPTLFVLFCLLTRKLAMVLGVLLVILTTATSAWALGSGLALRIATTLGFVLAMINVALNVVGQLQSALLTQAITDPLTGAYNRRHLQTHLSQLLVPAGAPAPNDSLLAFDVDHFKRINDNFGHAAGDEVLRNLVATLTSRKRRSDLLFRVGGEEFVLVLPRASAEAASRVAEDMRQRVEQTVLLSGQCITTSVGVSVLRAGQSAESWLQAADAALYEAKRAGRNRVVVAPAA